MGKDIVAICGDIQSQVYTEYIRGIAKVLDSHGYRLFIVDTEYKSKKEEQYLRYAVKSHFAGVFMLSVVYTPSLLSVIRSADKPIIFLNRHIKSIDPI
jgi:DNA-binding LacI/PurR family transcriptional regulator